jgi:hypothetical protein
MAMVRGLACILPVAFLLVAAAQADAHNCTCRNRDGLRYKLGQTACLNVDGRRFLARCEMKLNVSSWTKVDDGCPVSELEIRQSRPAL